MTKKTPKKCPKTNLVVVLVPGDHVCVGEENGDGETVVFVHDGVVAWLQDDTGKKDTGIQKHGTSKYGL